MKRIVFFGDGLAESAANFEVRGFGHQVAESYFMKADVLYRGFSGYNSREIQPLAAEIPALHPRVVFLAFGNSDSALEGQIQHIPLEEFESILSAMAGEVALKGAWPVLMTPVAPNEKRIRCRKVTTTKDYALAVRRIAEDMQIEVVDLFHAMQLCDDWPNKLLQKDGISLSKPGHELAANLCLRVLDQIMPRSTLPRLVPSPSQPIH